MSMLVKRNGQQWLPSIFNDFFNSDILVRNSSTAPAINVFETEKEYKVEVAAAGMCKDDFKIHIDSDNDLTITMEKNCGCKDNKCNCEEKGKENNPAKEWEESKGRYLRREFSYTRFKQTLLLPDDVDTSKIEAKMNNGVLCIEIPKKTPIEPQHTSRTISIG